MDTGKPAFTADCGHTIPALPAGHCGGTGYGTDPETGRTACYACCAERERAAMIATGRAVLYLDELDVTDWPGLLRFPIVERHNHARGTGGFHGAQRTDAWFHGPDGHVWHAVNRGDMQLARCRRTAQRAGGAQP